ncbi:MAG: DUF3298 domain-containing protein [Schwartzia succinivorans]|uniref:RsiV family protein n=1 Tax=Schwartzia succinivorans TaxID=55507 RepID=UPI0023579A32|nr:RsiV family protein [Schwartzia succinivorans]MBE6098315.1 DUF3298 domain-containing protein [Schwartzia succinivorans]
MWKKVLAAGSAVFALGFLAPIDSGCSIVWSTASCEEGMQLKAPDGLEYSTPLAYDSIVQRAELKHDDRVIMTGRTYEVELAVQSARKFPKLQRALERLATDNWAYMHKMMKYWEPDLIEQYNAHKADGWFSDGSTPPFCYELKFSGLRADTTVFSCVGEEFIFLGGAHPVTYYRGHVFDTKSGQELNLDDIFETTEGLAEIIVHETTAQCREQTKMIDKKETVKKVQKMIDDHKLQYGMTEEALVVYFGSYAIGPYAMGTMEVKLPYTKYMNMFNNKYVFYGEKAKG